MKKIALLFSFFLALNATTSTALAKPDLLFEGYYKVQLGNEPYGYIISRYEFDNVKKQFISTYFLKAEQKSVNVLTESLKAYATDDMKPISYEYTNLTKDFKTKKDVIKTIDAKFKNNKMTATINNGEKKFVVTKDLKDNGIFLSTFLYYVMLKSPQGLKPDSKYNYQAIAEEDASIENGSAIVKKQADYKGFNLFSVENEFKKSKYTSYLNDHAEIYAVNAEAEGIYTELVAKPSDAVGSLQMPVQVIKSLFGEVPAGTKNAVYEKQNSKPTTQPPNK